MAKNWISGKRDEKALVIRPSKREVEEFGKVEPLYVYKVDGGYFLEDSTDDWLIVTFSQAKKLAEKMVKDLTGIGVNLKVKK